MKENEIGHVVLDRFYVPTEERAIEIAESYFDFAPVQPKNPPQRIEFLGRNNQGKALIDFEKIYAEHGRNIVYYIRPDRRDGFIIVFIGLKKKVK